MNKKVFCLLLSCMMILISVHVFAAPKCPYHPNGQLIGVEQQPWEIEYESNDSFHLAYDGTYTCAECFTFLGFHTTKGSHHFSGSNGGYCTVCGYQRQDKAAYQQQAYRVLNDIDLRSGVAMYAGTICHTANGASAGYSLSTGNSYRIIEHCTVNGELWVKICNGIQTNNPIGWVKAENLSVDTSPILSANTALIGKQCMTKGGHSMNLRSGPGDYPIIGTAKKFKLYKIYDVATGTDGKTWYKISPNNEEWVSAAVMEIY